MDIAISVKNLSKKYRLYDSPQHRLKEALHPFRKKYHRDFWALKDVSFEVKKGECIGIIGQNGSGKSTLLQIMCGILQPTGGEAIVNGSISALLELGAGFNPEFTGRDNVYMNGALLGRTRAEMDNKFQTIADFAEIGDFLDQPVKTYSSGMFVRLAFAVAINIDPDILIIDEALAVGDDMFQRRCYSKLDDFKKQGGTIIFVSHSHQTITALCNKAIFLDAGAIYEAGEPLHVMTTYINILREREEAYRKRLKDEIPPQADHRIQVPSPKKKLKGHQDHFGLGGAEIKEAHIVDPISGKPTSLVETGKSYIIRVVVTFTQDVENPSVGFVVFTLTGIVIYGVNTYRLKHKIGPQKSGSTVVIDFTQHLCLNAGSYILRVGSSDYKSDHEVNMDSLDILTFKVWNDREFIGMIDFNPTVSMSANKEKGRG